MEVDWIEEVMISHIDKEANKRMKFKGFLLKKTLVLYFRHSTDKYYDLIAR